MKNTTTLLYFAIALVLFSCSPAKKTGKEAASATAIQTFCPEDGKCTTQLLQNKKLEVKTDEFGSVYYQLSDNDQTSVILYQYKRNVEKGLQDGHYTEEIVFEIPASDAQISISDAHLQQTKMLFGRLCFCRGQTGYYKVNKGILKVEQDRKEVHFNLEFTITEVPQVIHSIAASIK